MMRIDDSYDIHYLYRNVIVYYEINYSFVAYYDNEVKNDTLYYLNDVYHRIIEKCFT